MDVLKSGVKHREASMLLLDLLYDLDIPSHGIALNRCMKASSP